MSLVTKRLNPANLRYDLMDYIDEVQPVLFTSIADRVAPSITVKSTSGAIPKLDAAKGKQYGGDILRAHSGAYARGNWEAGSENYVTRVRGYEQSIDLMEDNEADEIFNLQKLNTRIVKEELLLYRDKRIADLLFSETTFSGSNDQQAATAAWDIIGSKTIPDINNAGAKMKKKKGLRKKQCSVIVTTNTIDDLRSNTDIKESIKYTGGAVVERMTDNEFLIYLAQYWGVKEIIEADSIYSIDGLEEDAVFTDIWSDSYCLLCYIAKGNSWHTPGVARQPMYTKVTAGKDMVIEDYTEVGTDQYIVRAKERRGQKAFSAYGVLMTGIKT